MAEKLVFAPEDFDSVLTYELLVSHLITIISNIRSSDTVGKELRNKITQLENYVAEGKNEGNEIIATKDNSNLLFLFEIYEHIKSISMEIRKLLSDFITLDTYDSIGYVFYYNNQRYTTDTIQQEWLIKGSKGSLSIDLEKAVKDLSKTYSDEATNKIQQIFNQHYASYLNAIVGMYRGDYNGTIGGHKKGSRLNRGHIAEAYESHLAEHHSAAYNLLNGISIESAAQKAIIAQNIKDFGESYWASHENPEGAWIHIRGALGTQRGTVAGDVGRFQVKQATSSSTNIYSSQVRLSSVANLKRGVEDYCAIVNPNLSIDYVARRLATYLSERVGQPSKELQAHIANKEFGGDLSRFELKRIIHI